jgi:hypothetical protein
MSVVSIENLSTKPDKLVLTKAEILVALAPIQNLAERIKETHGLFEAWHDTLPTNDDGEIIGFVIEEDRIEMPDGDLEVHDAVEDLAARDYFRWQESPLYILISTLRDVPAIAKADRERREAKEAVEKEKRAVKAAETRKNNAVAKREREWEKDRRIAELEEELASKPKLSVIK